MLYALLRTVALTGVLFGLALPAAAATCAPPKLVHITVANATPGIDPASFNGQPKEYYRIGSSKVRIEEAVDRSNGIHGIIVVDEPNIWMANLYDNTGKHAVDPGPTFLAKAPVFGQNVPGKLIDLEFGCENDFIAANAPKPSRSETIGTATFDAYRVDDAGDAVEILERSGTSIPAFARYYHQGSLVMVLRYDAYATGLPYDAKLFAAPANVRYTDVSTH
jgi:hypothetical protein